MRLLVTPTAASLRGSALPRGGVGSEGHSVIVDSSIGGDRDDSRRVDASRNAYGIGMGLRKMSLGNATDLASRSKDLEATTSRHDFPLSFDRMRRYLRASCASHDQSSRT
jgi:hypothetical protein